jgi:hypothetical protein
VNSSSIARRRRGDAQPLQEEEEEEEEEEVEMMLHGKISNLELLACFLVCFPTFQIRVYVMYGEWRL